MKKLYLAYMGAESKDRMVEDHEILMVVAEDKVDAKKKAKEKTKLSIDVHVDFILEISNIDGYEISLLKGGEENMEKVMNYSAY